mgnify:CR=1 FL=1
MTAKVLAFSTAAEGATGVALLAVPSLVGQLLLGSELPGAASLVARCFGIALVALGIACWPRERRSAPPLQGLRAMALYNGGIAAMLAYAGTAGGLGGVLLWPVVAVHAIVAILLVAPR